MTELVMIRHATTSWNQTGRLQGHRDIALSTSGLNQIKEWRLPYKYSSSIWIASPLLRAVQTARGLGCTKLHCETRLIEMDWGDWEGSTLNTLRNKNPKYMEKMEANGLDFLPPGGESPRQVQERIRPWLKEIAKYKEAITAVSHKGVIRAIYALAINWDFLSPMPIKLDWNCAHVFYLDKDGTPELKRSNVSLLL